MPTRSPLKRVLREARLMREQGPRERVRDVLQLNGVDWRSYGELRDRLAAVEANGAAPAAPPPPVPAPTRPWYEQQPGLADEILALQSWVAHRPPAPLKVSVVLPTRDRPELLARAVASVRAQTHPDWELLVVDDGTAEASREVLDRLDDDRISVLRTGGAGASVARNAGLDAATGDAVAYLDDDNIMLPDWLRTVAWAFDCHPDVDVVYGGCVRDLDAPGLPQLQLRDWNPRHLREDNIADQGVVAHRRGLPEARFAEDLDAAMDWELLARLTRDKPPLRLPALAMLYTRDAPGRISDRPNVRSDYARVRERVRRVLPLRVLAYNWMFPLVTETYIRDELRALVPHGAELAFYRQESPTSPWRVPETVYDDLDQAIADFGPDVLFLHWAGYAERELPTLERVGLPFAVRMHGFDLDPDLIARLQAHRLCVGVWTYPARGFDQLGDHALQPIFSSVDELPEPATQRDLVLSVSAGLGKKDFPVLVDAFARVEGAGERRIVLGSTKGFNEVPGEVVTMCEAHPDPPLVQMNLTRDQVFELQARAAVQVYTLRDDRRFGMPMSIIEGLCAGCAIVVPDRPECREYAGPHARTYRTAADIVRHCHEVLAGGPAIEREREANMAYGRERFCDPELGRRFHAQLVEGVARVAAR